MTMLAQDLGMLALATLAMPLVTLLPGFALITIAERLGLDTGTGWARCGWAVLLAVALLPALDALGARIVGIGAIAIIHLLLAAVGAVALMRIRVDWPCRRFALLVPFWWALVAIAYVDVDHGGRLYQSLMILDLVKHAAVIESLVQAGVPLRDPFVARDAAAGYYYFYYLAPAFVRWLGHGLVDSRMAFAASVFWTGIALPAALWRVAAESALMRPEDGRRVAIMLACLCFVGGADLPYSLLGTWQGGVWDPQVDW